MVNRFILSAFFLLILGVASVSAIDKYDNGTYIITAPAIIRPGLPTMINDDKAEKSFEIKEYVLPRFNTKVTLPSFGLNTDDKLTISISAKYTYGMPVKGVAYIKLNPKYWYSRGSKIPEIRKEEKIDGYLNISVPTSDIKWHLNKNKELNYFNLLVNVIVMEKLTSIKENGTSSMTYYSRPYRVNVVSSTSAFRPGMPYHAMVKHR
ncbi:uncharacterized protein TRIADDRAFT_62609 [Trichoplax adhaerens]|uniref:Macroglobulin domain-containing protein n=1 Tax=Trichoplax adhaerens TaxID=10228 RepID=B3SEB2_TRIAD|nr:hypothetical protein TRIADDRAFT_62609 [Trichoplax adhaerens]EDV18933.1 hypothetical protein TRIADDRAFT_62609 [Trichoplax adhaerens]|eukprot:XP_002118581.1 hypothetical protein TRIADDRAFT_62609 [Trichoplax adhaerens]